jgi:addiction module HigA family antidote
VADGRRPNVHPGDVLREDFLVGSSVPAADVTAATGLSSDQLSALLAGAAPVDADTDIRLTRYLGLSEGFFLRLQNAYDLDEARRAKGPEFDRIARRAA